MNNSDQPSNPVDVFIGLTKREHFAALAMQGLLSIFDNNEESPIVPNEENVRYMTKLAVYAADELLEQLDSPKS